ncbi:ubiquinol-cytochrome c reductase iron-sulfur subunit [Ammoniphilus sp. CFH 90114]|uniref:QcrA and Rieske domain-containing protein n=1 Tax=Ammoniphilus sp. CFH 90114 TaxID=2493665 RepID=UPI00100F048F|nr:ubiquinol-cytochrome c reductase iron-sulfur subunit [Ammoniphilus sp. CFH 90114]RXT13930.1 ubiquinol-cytochrome c reductase iron-sulfur subunit [Ammoniphilus sp. CFH 90114]
MSKKDISRRTFLNYMLMGTGGFLAAGMITPMARFALDPALKADAAGGDMVPVTTVDKLTNEPQRFDFKVKVTDGWYKTEIPLSAWVYTEGDNIIALSPICKHLGCTVQWNTEASHENHFFCPCHFGFYQKNGKNVPNTPPLAPLDKYAYEVKEGKLYLGKPEPNPV